MDHLTTEGCRQAEAYARDIADRLGLKDWTIKILEEPAGPTFSAQVQCAYGRKLARIKLGEGWEKETREERRHTIVHELVHCHMDGMESVMRDEVGTLATPQTHRILQDVYRRALELAVDGLADAIAPLMPPYPDKPAQIPSGEAILSVRKTLGL